MKNRIFALLLFLFFANSSQAQLSDEKRHFVSANLSLAAPLGDYGSTSSNNYNAGIAKNGVNFYIAGAYYFKPYIGVGANIGAFVNKIDQTAFDENLSNQLKSQGTYGTYSGTVGRWLSTYCLVGPYFTLPFKHLTLDVKVLGGMMTTIAPSMDITITPISSTTPTTKKSDATAGYGFGYGLGLALRYPLGKNPNWALSVHADYIASNPSFTQTTITTTGNQGYSSSRTFSQSIQVLNIGIGLAYQFNR